MVLTRIVPHAPGRDLRSFECPRCEHSEIEVVKFANGIAMAHSD